MTISETRAQLALTIDKNLSNYRMDFSRSQRDRAQEMINAIIPTWHKMIGAVFGRIGDGLHAEKRHLLETTLRYMEVYLPKVSEGDEGYYFESKYPIAQNGTEMMSHNWQRDPWVFLAVILDRFREAVAEAIRSADPTIRLGLTQLMSDPRLTSAIAIYTAAVEIDRAIDGPNQVAAEMAQRISESRSEIARQKQEWAQLTARRASETEKSVAEQTVAAEAFFADANDRITAMLKQAIAAVTLQSATSLWSRKAIRHCVGFWAGLLFMTAIVCMALYQAYWHAPKFLADLPKKADGEVSYITVIALIACVAASAWLLRFIGRFITENMVMQTDASQRHVMLQTYLALVGDKEAKMEQADRTLILNAIFRPLPGHQSDDIAPPTLLDLARNALPGGDKK